MGNIAGSLEKIIESALRKVRDKKDISYETLDYFWLTTQSLGNSVYSQKYRRGSIMYQVDLLYLILDITLKIYQLF